MNYIVRIILLSGLIGGTVTSTLTPHCQNSSCYKKKSHNSLIWYEKKCLAKQSDIAGPLCPCGHKKSEHTLHRHQFKYSPNNTAYQVKNLGTIRH